MTTGFQQQPSPLDTYPSVRSVPKPQHIGQTVQKPKAPRPPEPRSFEPKR